MDMQLVTDGLEFPEGPIAMADGSIILTEIKRGGLTRVAPDGTKSVFAETGGGPNGAAVGPDNAIYVTNNGGSFEWLDMQGLTIPGPTPPSHTGGSIQRIDLATGEIATLYDSCDGKRLVGPNDLVFDRTGGFWFTDHGCSTPDGRKFGALYYARPDGSKIVRARDHFVSPNGVGLSPVEDVVYMADTNLGRLWAFDIAEPGELKPAEGCVATIINGGITAFDPDGSTEHFAFPDLVTTNICFGGADMRDAWITCSSTGKLFKCRWPRPGLKLNFNA
jgi:gluconolactonase